MFAVFQVCQNGSYIIGLWPTKKLAIESVRKAIQASHDVEYYIELGCGAGVKPHSYQIVEFSGSDPIDSFEFWWEKDSGKWESVNDGVIYA